MGFFSATIAAKLAGRVVRMARLVELDFADGVGRYWEGGTGDLLAGGQTWSGTGNLATISGIESALGGTAPQVTIGLSGVNAAAVARLVSSDQDVKGRPAKILIQFFDEATLAALDQPYAVYVGTMDVMSADIKGPTSSAIQVTCEGLFTGRGRPPYGYLSDRSQQALYPGDTGLQFMASMQNASPFWPIF